MTEPVTFFHYPMSRARIVHWMLEEVGAPYETRIVDLQKGEHKQPAYLEINPMGKVPAIIHRGIVVTETAAICAYLADAFPEARLAPALDDPARGTYLRWLFFGAGCVEPAVVDKLFPRGQETNRATLGYGTYDDALNALEKAVSNGWILGERFSAADVYIGSQIGWGMLTKGIDARPAFVEYAKRCEERPAYKRMAEECGRLLEGLKK